MHSEWEQRPGSILIRAFVSRIKAGVDIVEILLIHSFFGKAKSLTETYKMEIINLQMRHSILMESLVA